MSGLLIHSMAEFGEIILAALACAGARDCVEIGAEFGGMSQLLAGYCETRGGRLVSIDPAPQADFLEWVATAPHVSHIAEPSLAAIPTLRPADAWLIDGDHNYHTVSQELALINAHAKRHGRPLLAILHDVGWPCGRRDFYYAPERIPPAHRHAHSFTGGVTLGKPDLLEARGFRGGGHWAWALHAGGPGNGVLTAVEDFLARESTPRRVLADVHIPAVFGLGILFDRQARWADALAARLAPWHDNPLLATLEANRLRNYLAVIDWQDRAAEAGS